MTAYKSVFACDCIKVTTVAQDFSNSKFVVYGIVMYIAPDLSNTLYEGLVGNVQSLEVFKGSANSIKTVSGGARNSAGLCIEKLEPGEYILYSNKENTHISSCSLSMNISKFSLAEKQLLLKSLRDLGGQQHLK